MERTDERFVEPVLIVGARGEGLRRAFAHAGMPAALVSTEDAATRAGAETPAVVIDATQGEAATLCSRLRARAPTADTPLLVLAGDPPRGAPLPEDPIAWLSPRARAATVVRRAREMLRLRRAERENARLNETITTLAAENERLRERARRDAAATAGLLRELQHRVRNNLASIQALLVLERHRVPPRPLAEALDVAIARLRSMAALHESQTASGDAVDLASLARAVARSALEVFAVGQPIALEVSGEATVPSRMGSALALVLNELVTNAVQHAGPTRLQIGLARAAGRVRLHVADDGRGLPRRSAPGNGLRIVRTVVETELHGEMALDSARPGTRVAITVPLPEELGATRSPDASEPAP